MNQAWSTLSVSKQLPVFHMFWCVFQENLPRFYWMCSEAVWLVVPRVFLFTFFQNEPDVFPVWGFTLLLRLLRCDWELLGHFQHQPIPSEPWDASQWVLWTDVCSGISRGLQLELHWEWRELQSTVAALRFRELRDVGREIHIESWSEKLLNTSAFSILVFASSHVLFVKGGYVCFNLPFSSQCFCRTVHFLLTL